MAGGRYPFACTVIARRGEIAYCDYLGHRDVEAGTPYALDTIVRNRVMDTFGPAANM